jgi:hypothetical protein
VAVLGSYLRSFAAGRIEALKDFDLDAVTGDDPRAAKLARVLAYYAERLPEEERELLARLSVFPRGVTLELIGVLIDAGGEVAGLLADAKARLAGLLSSLRARGLVFEYRTDNGRERDAYDLFLFGLGGYGHLGKKLGVFDRGYRILAAFTLTGRPEDLGPTIALPERSSLALNLALFADSLGRLPDARAIRRLDDNWKMSLADPTKISIGLQNSCDIASATGLLPQTLGLATQAMNEAEDAKNQLQQKAHSRIGRWRPCPR